MSAGSSGIGSSIGPVGLRSDVQASPQPFVFQSQYRSSRHCTDVKQLKDLEECRSLSVVKHAKMGLHGLT
jgi:hypothetical protein